MLKLSGFGVNPISMSLNSLTSEEKVDSTYFVSPKKGHMFCFFSSKKNPKKTTY